MPEYAVTFMAVIQAPDRLQAWHAAQRLTNAFELGRYAGKCNLVVAKVSEVETKQPETAKGT